VSVPQTVTIYTYRLRAEMFRPLYLLIKVGGYGDGKFIYFSNKDYNRILHVVYGSGQKTLETAQY
jgi:hypothetical protein